MFEHKGIKIEVNKFGRFEAQVAEVALSADTLATVKEQIEREVRTVKDKRRLSLAVVGVLGKITGYGYSKNEVIGIGEASLIGVNRTTSELQLTGVPKGHKLDDVIADTPANRAHLARLIEARRVADELEAAQEDLGLRKNSYGRIDAEKYGGVIDAIEKKHAAQMKGGAS